MVVYRFVKLKAPSRDAVTGGQIDPRLPFEVGLRLDRPDVGIHEVAASPEREFYHRSAGFSGTPTPFHVPGSWRLGRWAHRHNGWQNPRASAGESQAITPRAAICATVSVGFRSGWTAENPCGS